MAEVRFKAAAIRDIESIHAYIAKDVPRYADEQVKRFYAEVDLLARFPKGGAWSRNSRNSRSAK